MNKYSTWKILLIAFFLPLATFAQRTETALDFSPKTNRLVLEVENDLLFNTDSYYTAGIGLAYINKKLKRTPIQRVFKVKEEQVLIYTSLTIILV